MSKIYWIHWENPWRIYMKSGFLFQIDWAIFLTQPISRAFPSSRCPHKIELTFDSRANIQELPEDGSYPRCPLPHFEVKPLSAIEESEDHGRFFWGDSLSRLRYFFGVPENISIIPYPGNLYIYINLKREIDDKPWNFGVGIAFLEHFWLTIYTPWLVRRTR